MDVAERTSQLSHAIRLQVGAIVVKDDRIISIGYNGMPSGWDNMCEDIVWDTGDRTNTEDFFKQYPYKLFNEQVQRVVACGLKTKSEVLHAETNAIAKLAKSNESGVGATLFITHAPCLDCAKLIYQSGISSVLYRDTYRDTSGITFLEKSGIIVEKLND